MFSTKGVFSVIFFMFYGVAIPVISVTSMLISIRANERVGENMEIQKSIVAGQSHITSLALKERDEFRQIIKTFVENVDGVKRYRKVKK